MQNQDTGFIPDFLTIKMTDPATGPVLFGTVGRATTDTLTFNNREVVTVQRTNRVSPERSLSAEGNSFTSAVRNGQGVTFTLIMREENTRYKALQFNDAVEFGYLLTLTVKGFKLAGFLEVDLSDHPLVISPGVMEFDSTGFESVEGAKGLNLGDSKQYGVWETIELTYPLALPVVAVNPKVPGGLVFTPIGNLPFRI